jgi:hypothetical protein|tara:strand:- start:66 stop:368 length:303 start_codon:yes stop_codon:yes gene_type:complete
MKTQYWNAVSVFDAPIMANKIEWRDAYTRSAESVDRAVANHWESQLLALQTELKETGIETAIRPYNDTTGLNALYQGERLKKWPGQGLTLRSTEYRGGKL